MRWLKSAASVLTFNLSVVIGTGAHQWSTNTMYAHRPSACMKGPQVKRGLPYCCLGCTKDELVFNVKPQRQGKSMRCTVCTIHAPFLSMHAQVRAASKPLGCVQGLYLSIALPSERACSNSVCRCWLHVRIQGSWHVGCPMLAKYEPLVIGFTPMYLHASGCP